MLRLTEAARLVADVFASGGAAEALVIMQEYVEALRSFDASSGLGIFGNEHATISEAAQRHGLCYKPCGAGGGDIGVVLYAAGQDTSGLLAELERSGTRPLPLQMASAGLTISEE